MRWRFECQTCQRAKCYGYGICFACDENECKYKPFVNTISTTTQSIIGACTYAADMSEQTLNLISPTNQP